MFSIVKHLHITQLSESMFRPCKRTKMSQKAAEAAERVPRPFNSTIRGEMNVALRKIKRKLGPDNTYVQLIDELIDESESFIETLTHVCAALSILEKDDDTIQIVKKRAKRLQDYLGSFTKNAHRGDPLLRKRSLVLDCPLFDQRPFQYGPACAIAKKKRNRFLMYYPLGSGKTLAALHAARTFLELHPDGRIVVLTTLANVHTTWAHNQALYLQHVSDKHGQIGKAMVHNIDWWFSQKNTKVKYYNQLIHTLSYDSRNSLRELIGLPKRELKKRVGTFRGKLPRMTKQESANILQEHWLAFKRHAKHPRKSMLQATVPEGPFCLIVDECQEYINISARADLVLQLAGAANVSLFLSATPINDAQTQVPGLEALLNTRRNFGTDNAVLWTSDTSEKPTLVNMPIPPVVMTKGEWRAHQRAATAKTSDMHSVNAYLVKSRQTCNCISKWEQMLARIDADCARFAGQGGPIRIVVYSFFLKHGSTGFFDFVKNQRQGQTSGKRFKYTYGGIHTEVSLMHADTLQWFNEPGQNCKILLLSSKSGTGISLKNVRAIHLMEPQWSIADEEQAIGRCTRKGSHDRVPKQVQVLRWIAVPPRMTLGRTAGQKVIKRMKQKKARTETYLNKLSACGNTNLNALLMEFDRNHIK